MTGLSVLSARLVQIQLVNRKHYAENSRKTYHYTEKLMAIRGMIVDRHEEPLAKSIPVSHVMVDKKHLFDPKLVSYGLAYQQASGEAGWKDLTPEAQRKRISSLRGDILDREPVEVIVEKNLAFTVGLLARPLGMRKEELHAKIMGGKDWFPIAKDIPQDVADNLAETIKTNWIEGIQFENSLKRWYTAPNHATHLTGFTGEVEKPDEDGKLHTQVLGKFGVEASMESFLADRDG
ncbi:MAG: hypothetical protein EOP83_32980 [Verrucomicrobiaceae bacterium]|nr:MAG: hypothetical protein EOP83_32980 [Verrucomicrobiaceae bacterium]